MSSNLSDLDSQSIVNILGSYNESCYPESHLSTQSNEIPVVAKAHQGLLITYTVKPLNKGHFGNNINLAVMSFVERFSSSQRFKMYSETNYLGP